MATMPISTTNKLATRIGAGQRTTAVPTRRQNRLRAGRLDFEQPDPAAEEQDGRSQRDRNRHDHDHADRDGRAHGAEVGQPRETEAVRRPGDRQARAHDDGSDGLESGVVGRIPVLHQRRALRDSDRR